MYPLQRQLTNTPSYHQLGIDITPGPPIPPPRVLHRDSAAQGTAVLWCASFLFYCVDWEEISRQITSSAVQRKSSPVCFCLCVAVSLFPTQSFGEGDYKQEVRMS